MSTTARLFTTILIAASFGVALATGAGALFENGTPANLGVGSHQALQEIHATIRTGWLVPVNARRSLDERHQALERWVADRGGHVRLLDDAGVLRTRNDAGARLDAPLAQLARTIAIFVPQQQASDVAQALAGPDVTVGATLVDAGALQPTVEF
jgi:hypothetical protein